MIVSRGAYFMTKITQEELNSVDPKIKDIIANINKLSFIEKTHYSCEGHPTGVYDEDICNAAFVAIEYKVDSKYTDTIDRFRHDLSSVPFCDGEVKRKDIYSHHYTIHNEFQKNTVWDSIENVISKYMT